MAHGYELRQGVGAITATGFPDRDSAQEAAWALARDLGWTEWVNVGHVVQPGLAAEASVTFEPVREESP